METINWGFFKIEKRYEFMYGEWFVQYILILVFYDGDYGVLLDRETRFDTYEEAEAKIFEFMKSHEIKAKKVVK